MHSISDFSKNNNIPGKLIDNIWNFPNIQTKTSKGKIRNYLVIVKLKDNDGNLLNLDHYIDENLDGSIGEIISISGEVNGKHTETKPQLVKKGKNIGRSNETTILQQTLLNARTRYNKQLKKVKNDSDIMLAPMLAKRIEGININYTDGNNYYIQRKRDGVRAMSVVIDNKIALYSRGRELYLGVPHVNYELKVMEQYPNLYLDGELYLHGELLQDINGTASTKLLGKKKLLILEYWVFDIYDKSQPNLTFDQRLHLLNDLFSDNNSNSDYSGILFDKQYIKKVETYKLTNNSDESAKDQVKDLYDEFLYEGYEGAILRKGNSIYRVGTRSSNLLKIKPVFHDEFKCVGFTEGKTASRKGTIIYICETNQKPKKTFNVTVKGMSINRQKDIYNNMRNVEDNGKTYFENNYKNKMATIEYLDLSKDGKPQKAHFINFRNDL